MVMAEAGEIAFETINDALEKQPLFDNKSWQLSPKPWSLSNSELKMLTHIGEACYAFYRAVELLYVRAHEDKNLLRNKDLKGSWVAEYLNRGKPENLIAHGLSKRLRGQTPMVIRPDLLITEDGFAMTEIDSVPGGIGLTAFLNQLYSGDDSKSQVVGGKERMIDSFFESLHSLKADKSLPLIVILVSDEAKTYRPEMDWLAERLREKGKRVYCYRPQEVIPLGSSLCVDIDGNPEEVDIVYRFWELFDLANVSVAQYIMEAWDKSELVVTPPMRTFQEEKMNSALFHHHLLEDYWKENLSRRDFSLLRKIIPKSWIIDKVDLPPSAVLDAPFVGGKAICDWEELAQASQKERNLIIKLSGFHENAWGARSVLLGSDCSRIQWQQGLREAIAASATNPFIIQEYKKPKRLNHPIYEKAESGEIEVKEKWGRVRLCPYYFVKENTVELCGVLSTFCPADKKIIHGMSDAALMPCCLE